MLYNSAAAEQIVQHLVCTTPGKHGFMNILGKGRHLQAGAGRKAIRQQRFQIKEENRLQNARDFSGIHQYKFDVQSE